jgi:putative membrane protein
MSEYLKKYIGGVGMQVYLVLGLVFSIGVAIFAVQNASMVNITVFFWKFSNISLVVVIFASALIGAMAAGLFGAVKQIKIARSSRNQIEALNVEIEYLQSKLKKYEQPIDYKADLE